MVVENRKLPRVSISLRIDNPLYLSQDKTGVLSLLGIMLGKGSKNISKVQTEHGCQIFIEDPLELIERYIRVISEVNDFLNILSDMIISDEELKIEHKEMWKKIYNELQ
mgnify:CR=1 FL=1